MAVEWPDRRSDVVSGLVALAGEPVLDKNGTDQRWPDLTNAVHWVVDDTGWDQMNPSESIGTLLVDGEEAEAVQRVVALIVAVSERRGAESADDAWCADGSWPAVREAATLAADLLRRHQG